MPTDQTQNYGVIDWRAEERHEHPLIRTHPVTARKDSLPILQLLQDQATRTEFQTRVRWEPGTITLWDNRCV